MLLRTKRFSVVWNGIVFLVAIYVAITIPLRLAFDNISISGPISNSLISLVFFVDFVLNARHLKRKRRKFQCNNVEDKWWYQHLLLFTDFLAAIPFTLFIPLPALALFRQFKLVRTYHIFRLAQQTLLRYAGIFTFFAFLFWVILAINGLACGWNKLELQNIAPDFATDYINALYWTITTITTVGYGDIIPVTNAQKLYAIFVQILGFGVFTFIIGTVASQLLRKDPARIRYEENIEGLASLMHYKTLPGHLRIRIVDFYKYMWKRRLGYDESSFLESLPENLQTEVALHLKKEVIEKVSLFNNASATFKAEIALLLKPIFLTPGDYIFKTGDSGNEMYFVVSGELNTLTQAEDRVIIKLKAGDYFGEISLLKNKNRSATIKALNYCDLYMLDKDSFDNVINRYPGIKKEIETTIELRESNYS